MRRGSLERDVRARVARADDEHRPVLQLGEVAVVARVELPDPRIEIGREARDVRLLHHSRRDDDVVGLEPLLTGGEDIALAILRQCLDGRRRPDRKLEARGVRLEVVGHLVCRRVRRALRREAHSGEPVVARGRVEPERVPAVPPRVADALARVEDDERLAPLREVVAGREPCLPASDDHGVEHFGCHLGLLVVSLDGRPVPIGCHRTDPPIARGRTWSFPTTCPDAQTRSCSNANAVAAEREESPSFAKMFWTWRATVCSLMTSDAAISRFVFPAATSRSTSSSRAESP